MSRGRHPSRAEDQRARPVVLIERATYAGKLAVVVDFGRAAVAGPDIAAIMAPAMAALATVLDADRAVLIDFQGEERHWKLRTAEGPVPLDAADCERAFGTGVGLGVGLCVPIPVGEGVFAAVAVHCADPERRFTPEEVSLAGALSHIAGAAVDRIRADEKLHYQAQHDPLTGLPNRVLLVDRLRLALGRLGRPHAVVGVLFVDVDQFKVINDSLGHDQGDRLLVLIAQRLRGAVRPGDTVARFGGDEFVVLCEGPLSAAEAAGIGERIQADAARPLLLDGQDYFVTVSTGIALAVSPHTTAADLLRDADSAMYQAKKTGRGRSATFTPSMRTTAVRRLDTELALRQAIVRSQLRVHYQPVVNLSSGRVDGVEALVRWEHPTRGMIMPADFIPIAEETGLIVPLGEWVLGQACRQVQAWRCEHPQLSHLMVSVNLSARQVAQSDLTAMVAHVLADTGLAASAIVLEITETILMADAEYTINVLRGLKDLGVFLGIDDFGTGYSSLSYLKKFPVDALKIDRSFVHGLGVDEDDSAIVQATITLARSLGLSTVGEGVERPGQAAALIDLGCDRAQGYLFSPPQLAGTMIDTLLRSPAFDVRAWGVTGRS